MPCRSWGCDYCRPNRRRQLIARAASGQPNKFLTLTVNPHYGASALERRDRLHDAWTKLVKRILRQFALPPERRWVLTGKPRQPGREAWVRRVTAETPAKAITRLPYAAFIEKTKLGEPHLHILLRVPYIPQDWIAEQMADMTASPICDIRAIANNKQAIGYVTKYVGKEPAQFGNRKRYWFSKNWTVDGSDAHEPEPVDWRVTSVVRERWSDEVPRRIRAGYVVEPLDDGWARWWRPGTAEANEVRARWAYREASG